MKQKNLFIILGIIIMSSLVVINNMGIGVKVIKINNFYSKSDTHVYYYPIGYNGDIKYKTSADPSTFVAIKREYGKDNAHVYYQGKVIKNADPTSFMLLEDIQNDIVGFNFAKDKNHIYLYDIKLDADRDTWQFIDEGYSKDKDNVFNGHKIIDGADPQSFVVLDNNYTKDRNFVYNDGQKMDGINPADFRKMETIDHCPNGPLRYVFTDGKNYHVDGEQVEKSTIACRE